MIDPVELASTIVGLGSAGFVSSIGLTAILNSTVTGLTSNISSMIDPVELASTVVGIGAQGIVSSVQLDKYLASTTNGLGTAGYISSLQLQSTTVGLQNYISTVIFPTGNTYGEVLYLNYSKPLTSPYRALETIPIIPSLLQSSIYTVLKNTSNQSVAQFKTDFGLPPFIPTGIWDLTVFAKSLNNTSYIYASLHLLYGDNSEIFLTSAALNPIQVVTPIINPYTIPLVVPYSILSTSASVVLRIYANNAANQPDTLSIYFENGEYSHIHTTFGTIIPEQYLTSTVAGLGTAGYISTAQFNALSNYYKPLLSNNYSTNLSTVALFTSNTSNYFMALQGSTLSLSTGTVTTSTLLLKDPYASSIPIFQSSSLLFFGNVVLAGYGQLQPQYFTF
jgi:hypothetical protein